MGECYLHGNGGGAPLNFKVVSGTSAPSNPKENTIWINTDKGIPAYFFAANVNEQFAFVSEAGTVLGTLGNSRTFTKKNSGLAIYSFCKMDYSGPIIVSPDPNAVVTSFPGYENNTYNGTVVVDGVTYYYNSFGGFRSVTVNGMTPSMNNLDTPSNHAARLAKWFSQREGMVWIKTGNSSPVEFNALKKNGIQVYPHSAKQYVGGTWVDKTAKTYLGGEWCEWIPAGALFWQGNQFDSLTGGWYSGNVFADAAGTFTTNGGMLNVAHTNGGYSSNAVRCTNKISLSGASALKCNVASMSGTHDGFKLCVSTSNFEPVDATAVANISKTGETALDVSGLTGSYYVYIFSYTSSTKFSYSVDKVWYE